MDQDEPTISNAQQDGIETLYHYQKYNEDHVVDLLKTRRAFCSNIGNLNDPWDCGMFFKIDDDESATSTLAFLKAVAKPSRLGPAADRMMDEAIGDDPQLLRTIINMVAQSVYNDSVEHRRIYCLTPCVTSTLMWSHYADNHKGICLEYAVKPANVFATAFRVIYRRKFLPSKMFDLGGAAFLPFIVKAECWHYEKEYRLFLRIADPSAPFQFPECMQIKDDRVTLPNDCLTSVVLGSCSSSEVGIRVQQLIAEYWPEVRVKQMVRRNDEYELEMKEFHSSL